jgi:dolichol-phosphate mannosyltransferase
MSTSHTDPVTAIDRVWVVLPTYNEIDNLQAISTAILDHLPRATVLVVDDASPDGTGDLADRLAGADDRIRVLHRAGKEGLGKAYRHGFRVALDGGAGIVVQMDADFSHDPAELPRLLGAIADGADVAIGSRYVPGARVEGWPLSRRLISRGGGRYASMLLGLPVKDPTGGFKCFRADALRSIGLSGLQAGGYAFQIETTYRAARLGLRVVEVPITFRDRTRGNSKMSAGIAVEAAWRVPLLRLHRPAAPGPAAHAAVDHVPHLAGSVPLHERRTRRRPLP